MISLEDRIVDDGRAMADTERKLTQRNPAVSAEVIHTLVEKSYHRLTPAKVHHYLPILVSRDVQATLRRRHTG
jgi:hypoxanthine-guanine phosphoribosyltransferase